MLSFLFITEVTFSHVLNVTNKIEGTAKESVSVARHINLTFVLTVKGVLNKVRAISGFCATFTRYA